MSRSLTSVGPNATLVADDLEAAIRGLKAELAGEIAVSGPELAQSLTDLGLIDEYRLYFHPVVLGRGKPFFAGPRPPLRLVASDRIGEDVIRLTYVPADREGGAVQGQAALDAAQAGKMGARPRLRIIAAIGPFGPNRHRPSGCSRSAAGGRKRRRGGDHLFHAGVEEVAGLMVIPPAA